MSVLTVPRNSKRLCIFQGKKFALLCYRVSCYAQIICQNIQRLRHLLLSLPVPAHFIAKIPVWNRASYPEHALSLEGRTYPTESHKSQTFFSCVQPTATDRGNSITIPIFHKTAFLTQSYLSVLTCCQISISKTRTHLSLP